MARLDTKNPFNEGVSYEMFLSNVKGKTTEADLIKKLKLDSEAEDWLKSELINYKNK